MATPNEWKNPSDIMKTHLMQRHSSFSLTKTKSTSNNGISRRHSFTILSQQSDNIHIRRLKHPQHPPNSSQHTSSQKRKNPFGCDTALSNQSKRRGSVLDQNITTENNSSDQVVLPPCGISTHQIDSDIETNPIIGSTHDRNQTDSYTEVNPSIESTQKRNQHVADLEINPPIDSMQNRYQTGAYMETNSSAEPKQNRLICALTLQEQKVYKMVPENPEADLHKHDPENHLTEEQPSNILKEKPVILNTEIQSSEIRSAHTKLCTSPPLDWSLKSKLRATVVSSVGSFKKYPGIDAKNVYSFFHHKLDNSQEWKDLDIVQQIRRCCMHYTYPHLPWLSTFPRQSSDFKSRFSTFTSVYQQLCSGLCPYFYVCTYQFTVLFRCLRSSDSTSWTALLSPSTRGLREMLTKEGIEFRMPNIRCPKPGSLQKYRENGSCHKNEDTLSNSQPDQHTSDSGAGEENSQKENNSRTVIDQSFKNDKDDSSDDENDIDGDDEASRWLEGMGLDKKDFPSLEPSKVKLQREGFREIDNRLQSLVYVEGVDVHSFFNFLLNYPSCIASSGPQHGIPPTILSPVSFAGGRLTQNMVKHTTLSDGLFNTGCQLGSPRSKSTHVFEISGPILPHNALNIASILHGSPDCESSSVSFNTHSPSTAFNTQTINNAEKDKLAGGLSKLFVELSQANPGLLQDVKHQILTSSVLDTGTAVREMQIVKSGYSWTC